jgi:hypothetical protein
VDDGHRVRVEGRDDRIGADLASPGDETGEQTAVTQVDAVEVADRHDRASGAALGVVDGHVVE